MKLREALKGNNPREFAKDLAFDLLGGTLFAAGIQIFSSPNNIAPGGATGLSIILNYLTGLPLGILSLSVNIPLLVTAWFLLGSSFTLKTLKTVIIISALLDVLQPVLPPYVGEPMLAALYGGVLAGIGLSLVLMRGGTTGGSDIVSRLIQLRLPGLSVGRLLLVIDGLVLLAAAIAFRSIENALYGLISIFASTRIIDSVLYGLDRGKLIMVVSAGYKQIEEIVLQELGRGCTRLKAEGSYTGQDRPVLLCAVRKGQFFALKKIIYRVDPTAFVVALESGEILGEGFKSPT